MKQREGDRPADGPTDCLLCADQPMPPPHPWTLGPTRPTKSCHRYRALTCEFSSETFTSYCTCVILFTYLLDRCSQPMIGSTGPDRTKKFGRRAKIVDPRLETGSRHNKLHQQQQQQQQQQKPESGSSLKENY